MLWRRWSLRYQRRFLCGCRQRVVKPRAPLAARSTVQSTALYIRDMAAIACTASSPIASTAPARIRRVGPWASAPSRPAPMVGGISMTVNNSRVRGPRIRARAGASADDERPPAPPRSILAGHDTATEGGFGGVRGCAVAAGLLTVAHAKPLQPPATAIAAPAPPDDARQPERRAAPTRGARGCRQRICRGIQRDPGRRPHVHRAHARRVERRGRVAHRRVEPHRVQGQAQTVGPRANDGAEEGDAGGRRGGG